MIKLPVALLMTAMAMGTCAVAAEDAQDDSQSAKAQAQDCAKLSGKEKDKCVQATPAGPVDMKTGAQKKGKSETAKDRDRAKEENQTGANTPAQSNDAVGKPDERSTTGEAQTGAGDNKSSAKTSPDQSKDTVGQPDKRKTTGEAQSGQQPGKDDVARKQ